MSRWQEHWWNKKRAIHNSIYSTSIYANEFPNLLHLVPLPAVAGTVLGSVVGYTHNGMKHHHFTIALIPQMVHPPIEHISYGNQ